MSDNNEFGYNVRKSDKIFNAIYDTDRFKTLTNRYFKIFKLKENLEPKELKNTYIDFVYNTIYEKFESIEDIEGIKLLKEKNRPTIWRLKKRLAKSAMDSLDKPAIKFLKKEHIKLKEEYVRNNGEIKSINLKNPDDLIEYRRKELDKWSSDSQTYISEFIYFNELTTNKINSAFSYDLVSCIIEVLRHDYKYDINKIIINNPVNLPAGLFSFYSRGRKANKLGVSKIDELAYKTGDYDAKNEEGQRVDIGYTFKAKEDDETKKKNLNDIEPLILELINETTEKKGLSKIVLDNQDLEIIRQAYSHSYLSYYSFYLSDFIKSLGLPDTGFNINKIKNRLLKLPYYTFYTRVIDPNGNETETTFNLFSEIKIRTDNNGRKVVDVTKSFIKDLEKRSTELMYRNELKKLKLIQSIDLAYLLEGRRSYLIGTGKEINNDYHRFDIDFLKFHINMDSKKSLKRRMAEIELAFQEIKENQFIIKDYKVGTSYFEVLFYDDSEKRQLLLDNTILSLPDYLS